MLILLFSLLLFPFLSSVRVSRSSFSAPSTVPLSSEPPNVLVFLQDGALAVNGFVSNTNHFVGNLSLHMYQELITCSNTDSLLKFACKGLLHGFKMGDFLIKVVSFQMCNENILCVEAKLDFGDVFEKVSPFMIRFSVAGSMVSGTILVGDNGFVFPFTTLVTAVADFVFPKILSGLLKSAGILMLNLRFELGILDLAFGVHSIGVSLNPTKLNSFLVTFSGFTKYGSATTSVDFYLASPFSAGASVSLPAEAFNKILPSLFGTNAASYFQFFEINKPVLVHYATSTINTMGISMESGFSLIFSVAISKNSTNPLICLIGSVLAGSFTFSLHLSGSSLIARTGLEKIVFTNDIYLTNLFLFLSINVAVAPPVLDIGLTGSLNLKTRIIDLFVLFFYSRIGKCYCFHSHN